MWGLFNKSSAFWLWLKKLFNSYASIIVSGYGLTMTSLPTAYMYIKIIKVPQQNSLLL